MSRELLESIINKDYVAAQSIFETELNDIRDQKLYEEKRRLASLHEIVKPVKGKPGQFTGSNTKADWAKYRSQNKQVKWDQNKEGKKVVEKPKATPLGHGGKLSAHDIKVRRKEGYLPANDAINAKKFIDAVTAHIRKKKQLDEADFLSGSKAELSAAQKAPDRSSTSSNFAKKEKNVTPKGKTKPTPKGTQRGFTAPLSRAAPGSQSGFTAPLKGPAPSTGKDDGVTSGMRQTLRQKYRAAKVDNQGNAKAPTTASGLALKSLKRAVAPGTSLSGRYRAVKRAGTAFSKTTTAKVAKGVGSGVSKAYGLWDKTLSKGMSGSLE